MTRDDLKILCTALGFTAVIMKDVPADHQALRAQKLAQLIESFCVFAHPESFESAPEHKEQTASNPAEASTTN